MLEFFASWTTGEIAGLILAPVVTLIAWMLNDCEETDEDLDS